MNGKLNSEKRRGKNLLAQQLMGWLSILPCCADQIRKNTDVNPTTLQQLVS